jgi:hypothetical protein
MNAPSSETIAHAAESNGQENSNDNTPQSSGANRILDTVTRPWVIAIIVFETVCVRAMDSILQPHFWAEDGTIFWLENYTSGLKSLLSPSAGYLCTTQRIFTWLISWFPYALHPLLFSLCGALLTTWTALTIAKAPRNSTLGALLAVALVFTRHDDGNVFMNLVNIHWIMACALPIIIVAPPPSSKAWRINQGIFLCFAVLTGPFAIMLLPFWIIKTIPLGNSLRQIAPTDRFVGIVGITGALIQLTFLLSSDTTDAMVYSLVQTPIIWQRIFSDGFGVDRSVAFAAFTTVAVIAALKFPRYRALRLVSLYFLSIIALFTAFKFAPYHPAIFQLNANGPRYFFIPAVMLAGIALSLFFENERPGAQWLAIALTTLILAGTFDGGFVRNTDMRVFQQWSNITDKIGIEHLTVGSNPPYFRPIQIPPR